MTELDFSPFQRRETPDLSVYAALPAEHKHQLCLSLLDEFGAGDVMETAKGELRHRCTLNLGGHTDHDSMTASLNFNNLLFNCFVCGNSGGLLWWVAINRREGVEATAAWLKEQSGLASGLSVTEMLAIIGAIFKPAFASRVLPNYDERSIARWWDWPMFHPYLTEPWVDGCREIPEATLREFKVGYCDHDENWKYYQRIIIPLYWEQHLVGWQARKLDAADPIPAKYLNSPDTPRDRILYGAPEGDTAVVVESPMSVLRHAHHLPMVATLGTDVTDAQLNWLHRYRKLILWPDNDKAGWNALTGVQTKGRRKSNPGLIERLRRYVEVWVVRSPYGSIEGRGGAPDASDFTDDEAAELVHRAVVASLWSPPQPQQLQVYAREA